MLAQLSCLGPFSVTRMKTPECQHLKQKQSHRLSTGTGEILAYTLAEEIKLCMYGDMGLFLGCFLHHLLFLFFLERLKEVQEGRNRPPLSNPSRKELLNKFQVVNKEKWETRRMTPVSPQRDCLLSLWTGGRKGISYNCYLSAWQTTWRKVSHCPSSAALMEGVSRATGVSRTAHLCSLHPSPELLRGWLTVLQKWSWTGLKLELLSTYIKQAKKPLVVLRGTTGISITLLKQPTCIPKSHMLVHNGLINENKIWVFLSLHA